MTGSDHDPGAATGSDHGPGAATGSDHGPGAATLTAALEAIPLFRGLGRDDLAALASELRPRRYRRGEVIFRQGDPGDGLHILLGGRVKISSVSPAGLEAILATLRPGEFFGSLALLDGASRSATATALESTEAVILANDRFHRLMNESDAIRDHVFRALAHEVRRLTRHVEELHFLDIAGRLAARLSSLSQEHGTRGEDGSIRLDGALSQGELAAMVGSTRQSVNKLLGHLVDDGLIRVDREGIVILDPAGLEHAARR